MLSRKYENWDGNCWVRNSEIQLGAAGGEGNLAFPPGLVPYSQRLKEEYGEGCQRAALTQCLYGYLRFTEELELRSINRVGMQIALGETLVPVSRDLRNRAFLLVRDEAHHAAVSDEISVRIESLTGLAPMAPVQPHFLRVLGELQERVPVEVGSQLETAFATISETLISGSLSQIPRDRAVLPLIRDYAGEHAADEGRHQQYFGEFFGEWWPQLPGRVRQGLGVLLPDLCLAFLGADRQLHQRVLESCGLASDNAARWVAEAFPESAEGPSARKPLQATLRLFERSGVCADAAAYDAFAARGLI